MLMAIKLFSWGFFVKYLPKLDFYNHFFLYMQFKGLALYPEQPRLKGQKGRKKCFV